MASLRIMKRLFLLLLIWPSAAMASVTPNFTTGTMTQTTTATQTITETSSVERYGGDVQVWNGDNVKPTSTTDIVTAGDFEIVDSALPWQLEITTRAAGVVETVDTTRTIQTDTVTNTLSVFSQ
jgi:hypothetical protein